MYTYATIESIPLTQFYNVIKFKKSFVPESSHGHIIQAHADMFLGKVFTD